MKTIYKLNRLLIFSVVKRRDKTFLRSETFTIYGDYGNSIYKNYNACFSKNKIFLHSHLVYLSYES